MVLLEVEGGLVGVIVDGCEFVIICVFVYCDSGVWDVRWGGDVVVRVWCNGGRKVIGRKGEVCCDV